jgi:hypothetical protein
MQPSKAWRGGQLLLDAGGVRGPLTAGGRPADIMENTFGVRWSIQVHAIEMIKGTIFCGLLPVSGFKDCIEINGDHAVQLQVEQVQVHVSGV